MNSINKIARAAGLFYLSYMISSFVANLFGKFVFVEAPATVDHILTHAVQFRIGFVINLSPWFSSRWQPGLCTGY